MIETIPGCAGAAITVSVPLTVTVLDTNGSPQNALPVYAYDGSTYTNYNKTTNASGQVTLTLPLGNYRFRADKNGTQFWSASANHCTVPGCTSASIITMLPVTVITVQDNGVPQAGLPVYAYDGTTYTGYNGTTNASGQVTFTLPAGNYRFRADKNSTQFWSGSSNHCTVPGCTSVSISVSLSMVVTVQDTNNARQAGLPVYVYDGTTYKNFNGTTNVSGQVTFTLPVGNYRFRADKNGTQFWSASANHCTIPGCASAAITVSVPLTVTVLDTNGAPQNALPVYAYDGTTYTNYNKTTNASGQVTLTLPMGNYRFRADKNGTQFWSGAVDHCTLPGCTSAIVTVAVPLTVTVLDTNGSPQNALPVYAFDNATYTGYNKTTNASGQVTLTLPLGNYRFRADKNGTQFWSGAVDHCTIPGCASSVITVSVPVVVLVQNSASAPQNALPVYAYNGSTYTGYNGTTNASGQVTLTLPLGNYRFRADKNGQQYFSGLADHCSIPGCVSVAITLPVTSGFIGGVKVLAALPRWSTSLSSTPMAELQQSGTVTTTVIRYTYDPLGRLTSADYSTGESFAYAYDEVGNRTAQTATITSTQVTNYVYDAANRLASANGQAYMWSDNGNLLNDGNTVYAYDQANRLISVTLGVTTTQYAYNGDGARLKQMVNGSPTTYTFDLAAPLVQVLAQQDTGGKSAYLYGLTRIGEQQSTIINPQSPGWVYHLSDALGSVRQLADANAQIVLARGYTPYGEALWSQGTGQSAYGYTGEDFDTSTGLVFLRARYMDPRLGMFLARDFWSGNESRPSTLNGYAYVSGNPINRIDPSGLFDLGTIFRTYGLSPDILNANRYVNEVFPFGWLQVLLDAMPGDEITIDTYTPTHTGFYPKKGIAGCRDGTIVIDEVPAWEFKDDYVNHQGLVDPIEWSWGKAINYSLNGSGPFYQAQIGRGVYADWRTIRSLPDYYIIADPSVSLVVLPVSVGAYGIIDRYGNSYLGFQGGFGPQIGPTGDGLFEKMLSGASGGVTLVGGGYVGWTLDIINPTPPDEAALKRALTNLSLTASVDGGFFNLSVGTNGEFWNYYTAFGVFKPGALVGGQFTMNLDQKYESLGWDRLEQGLRNVNFSGAGAQCSCGCR